MGFGGLLAQYAGGGDAEVGRAIRNLVGTLLGFVAVIALGLWLTYRGRSRRTDRLPVSGWYPDPWGSPYERWWNGQSWTGNVRPPPHLGWYGAPQGPPSAAPSGPAPPPTGPPSDVEGPGA